MTGLVPVRIPLAGTSEGFHIPNINIIFMCKKPVVNCVVKPVVTTYIFPCAHKHIQFKKKREKKKRKAAHSNYY